MSFLLAGTSIRRPVGITETNSSQYAQQRTLDGSISRDYIGSNKRQWTFRYENTLPVDYAVIKAIYDSYVSTETAKTFQVTEANYTVSTTNVHIDLNQRGFSTPGSNFISEFDLVLTEA